MKFTLAWLKSHLDTSASLDEIAAKLTAIGLEVEGIEDRAAIFAPFIVAEVKKAEQHPNADKLRVCEVFTGTETIQVVCGAPNARAGMKGIFAPAGSTVPGTQLLLKATTIRGVASNGMLCSEREMGLTDEHTGIIDLPLDTPLGAPMAKVFGLDDPVIEIKLTPNRGDCLGVRGIARDLAAAGLGTLKPYAVPSIKGSFKSPIGVSLDFPAGVENACPVFAGRYIRGVKNGPSPAWLQQRLKAIGLRPISALVDITNFFTYDLGRPLHVFDAAKVKGNITARLAKTGEKLLALDGKEYTLDDSITVIADENGPEGLGGVMGGEHTGCSFDTTEVFLESAWFDPVRTATTGRKLGIHSDARHRFERIVDPAFIQGGVEVGTQMILDLCGGEASEVVLAGKAPDWKKTVSLRPSRLLGLVGFDLPVAEQTRILESLGFTIAKSGDVLSVDVPSWRPDIDGEADLVEEIARQHGFDAIPAEPLPPLRAVPAPAVSAGQRRVRVARRALAARGLTEAVTYSFIRGTEAEVFGGGQEELRLVNPISADMDTMRPSILPGLIATAKRNMDRGQMDVALFEIGPQYASVAMDGQSIVATGLRRGATGARHWRDRPRNVDGYDAKADALAALSAAGVDTAPLMVMDGAPGWYHPGRSGTLRLGPKTVLATFGELHPRVLQTLDIKGPVVAFEVWLERIPASRGKAGVRTKPALKLAELQAVERDFAFIVDADVQAENLLKAVRGSDKALIARASVFDVFSGAGIPEGKKSLAITVRLEPQQQTLTDAEIEAVAKKIVAAAEKACGATLRA
ncbi:phenylalanine--tRNA ligase subunit beta [Ferrovibrio terrae]|uniref:Phenylalanine--tRNA ligase beta subunit n=1 Tax=Ferrovibrio terrae TaxID=2594003 RepID=A0A516H0N8_9PROT|nr:phenylalanine--tRNA ligase subunit beta [Ferrovibrio terrae]QDO97343.1 phenylalanine--tRNA ligase subunit beta [Ferrovibrio terrae]